MMATARSASINKKWDSSLELRGFRQLRPKNWQDLTFGSESAHEDTLSADPGACTFATEKYNSAFGFPAGVAQLVEHNVANVVVVGSNPIARSLSQNLSQLLVHFAAAHWMYVVGIFSSRRMILGHEF